jgi:hypothetical protein
MVKIIRRILRRLTHQGLLIQEQGMKYLAEAGADHAAHAAASDLVHLPHRTAATRRTEGA